MQIKIWKGRTYELLPSHQDVLTGKKRLISCKALEAAKKLNASKGIIAPCSWIDEEIRRMPGCINSVYVPAPLGKSMAEADFLARFTDGSTLVWVGAYEEWGFQYNVEMDNPYVVDLTYPKGAEASALEMDEEGYIEGEVRCG